MEVRCLAMEEKTGIAVYNLISVCLTKELQALTETNVQCTVQQLVMINMRCLAMEEKIGMVVKILISVHLTKELQDLMVMNARHSVQLNVMVMICIAMLDVI